MSAACGEDAVTLLPREVRLVVERILLLTRLPPGAIPAVRDVVLYSSAAGLGGLSLLRRRFESLRDAEPAALRITEARPGGLRIDAGGQHSWMALPATLDALAEAAEREGVAVATVTGVGDPEELRAACALGPRSGLTVFFTEGGCTGPATGTNAALLRAAGGPTLIAVPAAGGRDAVLEHALRRGTVVEPELWWALHHLSNTALAADTPESRRHAGPVIVEADGRITGRSDHDDDTDISLLTAAKPDAHNAH